MDNVRCFDMSSSTPRRPINILQDSPTDTKSDQEEVHRNMSAKFERGEWFSLGLTSWLVSCGPIMAECFFPFFFYFRDFRQRFISHIPLSHYDRSLYRAR